MMRCALVFTLLGYFAAPWAAEQPVSDATGELQRRYFALLTETGIPPAGLVADAVDFRTGRPLGAVSIAGVGMQLAALPVGASRGWIQRGEAARRAERILRFLLDASPHRHGWMYHFIKGPTNQRAGRSEVSSIDTALLLAGALTAGQYFHETPVHDLAGRLYRRVDFPWMLTDGGARPNAQTLCMGWTDEEGFIKPRWGHYCELMILYQLAIGSPTHPIPPETWAAFQRPIGQYAGIETLVCGPLFTHQYAQLFIDFRNTRDPLGFNYFTSSVNATRINRRYCIDQADRFSTFSAERWGISACRGPEGYQAYRAPPARPRVDGTINPSAAAAAIAFLPDESQAAIDAHRGDRRVFGRFGLVESYNLNRNWYSPRVVSLDAGMALVAIENYRTGLVWRLYMSHPAASSAVERIGFVADEREDLYIEPITCNWPNKFP